MNEVDVCNNALTMIAANTISSLDEASESARIMTRFFYFSLDQLLEEHPWNFGKKRATLVRLAAAPEYGYDYAYQLPSDCLKVIEYELEGYGYEYTIEGSAILTNVETCKILYIKRVTDMNDLSPTFRQAFTAFLGAQAAPFLTNSAQYAAGAAQQYTAFLKRAKTLNARQNRKVKDSSGSWLTARYV